MGLGMDILANPVAVLFLSFIFGMMGNALLSRLPSYERLGDRYLFSSLKTYERFGVLWYRRILLATPIRSFNTDIRFSTNRSIEALVSVKKHMTNAELAHWIGFAAMLTVTVAVLWFRGFELALAHLIFNVIGNLYPCLLQQYNRLRLSKALHAVMRRQEKMAI